MGSNVPPITPSRMVSGPSRLRCRAARRPRCCGRSTGSPAGSGRRASRCRHTSSAASAGGSPPAWARWSLRRTGPGTTSWRTAYRVSNAPGSQRRSVTQLRRGAHLVELEYDDLVVAGPPERRRRVERLLRSVRAVAAQAAAVQPRDAAAPAGEGEEPVGTLLDGQPAPHETRHR